MPNETTKVPDVGWLDEFHLLVNGAKVLEALRVNEPVVGLHLITYGTEPNTHRFLLSLDSAQELATMLTDAVVSHRTRMG